MGHVAAARRCDAQRSKQGAWKPWPHEGRRKAAPQKAAIAAAGRAGSSDVTEATSDAIGSRHTLQ